jgi:hypothetical protein
MQGCTCCHLQHNTFKELPVGGEPVSPISNVAASRVQHAHCALHTTAVASTCLLPLLPLLLVLLLLLLIVAASL